MGGKLKRNGMLHISTCNIQELIFGGSFSCNQNGIKAERFMWSRDLNSRSNQQKELSSEEHWPCPSWVFPSLSIEYRPEKTALDEMFAF